MNEWMIGTDLGKKVDSSVIGVGRKMQRFTKDGRCISYWALMSLEMVERMSYTEQGDLIRKLDNHRELHLNNDLIIDGTGVGEAVCDILRDRGMDPIKIVFSSGDHVNDIVENSRSGFKWRQGFSVPKEDLVKAMKLSLEQRRFVIAKGIQFEDDIRKQFSHFVGIMSKNKNMIYNNDSNDVHDDIVCTIMMMNWYYMKGEGAFKDFRYKPNPQPVQYSQQYSTAEYDPNDYARR